MMSRSVRLSSTQRQNSKIFRADETKSGRNIPQKWRFTDNKKPLCLQYTNSFSRCPRKISSNLTRPKSRPNSVRVFNFLGKCRDILLEWLFLLHVKIFDFLLEPAEKLFPTEMNIQQEKNWLLVPPRKPQILKTRSMETTKRIIQWPSRRTWSEVR
uniref:Uncharacterized protein n=1 Tax=Bursaphelenchus xylophilus TaxID=6326 RepID=A0A1I7RSA6_BURXY